LTRLAALVRDEGGLLADALHPSPDGATPHGDLVAQGPRADGHPADLPLVVEAVREGYLLHYEDPRLLAGHDPDLALLAGDYLYALGLDRLAALGDTRAVAILSDLISACARLQAEDDTASIPPLWREAAERISASPR
jgi:hypothetical protein